MKWRFYIGLAIFACWGNPVLAQHFIGISKPEVKKLMGEERKELFLDGTSVNTLYNILKYTDRLQNQTLLFVFSENDICQYTKWMCDYSMKDKVVAHLNARYKKTGDNTWVYKHRRKSYEVTLESGKWFFTVTTRMKE